MHATCFAVIRAQDAVVKLQPGDTVQVLCTDPGVVHDIPAWCRVHGHDVFEINEQGYEIVIHIRLKHEPYTPA
jgi:tRNA 2-thiouridine synthesizing protein A